ncbi:MAG: phosphoribosylformylglycinamidine synthase subunit PurS [Candidatus Altiarchaeales archaeon]|nr:phosphoribosylformylglycinamidine synthase subunit PurS [Candidatus Altiarchaeales archaeon]
MSEFNIEVRVDLKPGVLDAEGETIQKSLKLLDYPVTKVETSSFYVITIEAESPEEALEKMDEACRRLLANPVIQDFSLKVL